FSTLTRNIRHRRGEKVVINAPIFKDKNTPSPFIEKFPEDDEAAKASKPDHIYMDAMGFGMGNCCLQVLAQVCVSALKSIFMKSNGCIPVILSSSSAGPGYSGIWVTSFTFFWPVLTRVKNLKKIKEKGASCYLRNNFHKSAQFPPVNLFSGTLATAYYALNWVLDKRLRQFQAVRQQVEGLVPGPVDHTSVYAPVAQILKIKLSDLGSQSGIQPSRWQRNEKLKHGKLLWKVQCLCNLELKNSLYQKFQVILTKLDRLLGLKVDENMKVAQKRDAVLQGMFYFRKDICKGGNAVVDGCGKAQQSAELAAEEHEEYALMSIDTIINGKEGVFPGLIPILNCYLENMEVDVDTRCSILNYLKLIKKRASGELMTVAKWMREFIANHPDYKQDSVITDQINYSLILKCNQIANELCECPELLGPAFRRVRYSGSKMDSSN
uniref:Glutamate--cysteine ligase n=2 Tax=Myotis lucifugus TaxID=59463 RepID=G1Q787_MYOLU